MPFANIRVEMALTQINNAYLFPWAALFIFSPYKEPNICRKKYHLQKYYQLMTWAEKNFFLHLLYSYHSFFYI